MAVSGVLNSCETLATKIATNSFEPAQFANVMEHNYRATRCRIICCLFWCGASNLLRAAGGRRLPRRFAAVGFPSSPRSLLLRSFGGTLAALRAIRAAGWFQAADGPRRGKRPPRESPQKRGYKHKAVGFIHHRYTLDHAAKDGGRAVPFLGKRLNGLMQPSRRLVEGNGQITQFPPVCPKEEG